MSLYCTFFLDNLFFGVEVLRVQEIIRYQEMTPVPLAPASVRGLINLRGQIVTAIDLRQRLGLPPRPDGQRPMNVVLHTSEGPVSLLVDQIGDVLELDERDSEPAPNTIRSTAGELTHRVYKQQDRLLLVLDTERAVAVEPVTAGSWEG